MPQPLMPKATAVWLVDNTTLTFEQIAEFVGLHPLEISGIADGEVAIGMKGFDPIANNQLTRDELDRCMADPTARLKLKSGVSAPPVKKKAPRYTPLSKRQDRPAAIAWLVRNHPELADSQITKLLGTTKTTIEAIRNKSHWNSQNIQPVDPVALGLCSQIDLDAAVKLAAEKKAAEAPAEGAPASPSLRPTSETLGPLGEGAEHDPTAAAGDPLSADGDARPGGPFHDPMTDPMGAPAAGPMDDPFGDAPSEAAPGPLDDPFGPSAGVDKHEQPDAPDVDPEAFFNLPKSDT